ncbi:HD-GYP domain-containing protein [Mobilicoccus pelagius]|uniref:Putative metal-dependent phosphohydrolase n=1 Tax=Mobilicoccus pelagius NBRC 104925 TaxID=1089455 RepID=H5URT4_9MICO|nr:HD domain-containing protein [Mobilicoccus pelagius]GAB48442.1 putative metal-dependent phosphohydrolase [Mobilicoccus pelagius NBRC 104925]
MTSATTPPPAVDITAEASHGIEAHPSVFAHERRERGFRIATGGIWLLLVAVVGAAVVGVARPDTFDVAQEWLMLALFLATITAGASMQTPVLPGRGPGPAEPSRTIDVGATAALALTVDHGLTDHHAAPSTVLVVAVAAVGLVVGGLLAARSFSGRALAAVLRRYLPRIVTVAGLVVLLRDLGAARPLRAALLEAPPQAGAVVLLAMIYGALILEVPLRMEFSTPRVGSRRDAYADALEESLTLGVVPAATAVLVAVAQPLLGPPALPLILLPLVFNQIAVRRHDEMREHARQSVVALSHLPEAMGVVRPGHAARVAHLSTEIGRELGMGRRDLAETERAALLHDLGQVRLVRPVPSGATVLAAPADQEEIALDGAEIARASGVLDEEAAIIEAQAVPYRHHVSHRRAQPLASRVIKVANAYDDLLTGASAGLPLPGPDAALERLYLGLGHEYDPRVVDVLDALVHGVSGQGGSSVEQVRT